MKRLKLSSAMRAGSGALGVLCALAALAGQASAADIFRVANPNDQRFPDALPHFFILNPSTGSDTLTFSCAAECRVAVLYNAECSVAATDTETSVNIDILVDGIAAPPSDGDNLFCTSNGTGVLDSWVAPAQTLVRHFPQVVTPFVSEGFSRISMRARRDGWMIFL